MNEPSTPRRRRVQSTRREQPAGSQLVAAADLGFARLERIMATEGCFTAGYAQYVAVLTQLPSLGPVRFNGQSQRTQERGQALNLFRPGDRVEGLWQTPNTYDALLFAPGHVERFLDEELADRPAVVKPLLRVAPTSSMVWLWRCLAAVGNDPADTAVMQTELISNLIMALLVAPQIMVEETEGPLCQREITEVVRYIEANLAEDLTIARLAGIARLSKFHFSRMFKRTTGYSVHSYIVEQRLTHARMMLESTRLPICQIALEAGFASQSHLNGAFKQRFGMTPRQWRSGVRLSVAVPGRRPPRSN